MKNLRGSVPIINLTRSTDFGLAMLLVEKTPVEAINNINKASQTNLGYAIREKADPRVLLALMTKCEDLLFAHKEEGGKLPLHSAVAANTPAHVVKEIISRSPPDALALTDDNGKLPLDLAVSISGTSYELVELLINKTPREALDKSAQGGGSILHTMSASLTENAVGLLLNSYPNFLEMRDNEGHLPIHSAVRRGASENILKAFIRYSPGCLLMPDIGSRLALHHVLPSNLSLLVFLLQKSGPESLFWRDKDGLLPIHRFLGRSQATAWMVKLMLNRYLDFEAELDWATLGREAIECALFEDLDAGMKEDSPRRNRWRRNAMTREHIVDIFLDASKHSLLEIYDLGGETVLHKATRAHPVTGMLESDLIEYLMDRGGPSALEKTNRIGMLPLHCLVQQGFPFKVVVSMTERYPDAVHQQDAWGRIPVHLASLNAECDLSILYFLLRRAPESLLPTAGDIGLLT